MFARPRPVLTAILIGLFAEMLFLWGIAVPHKLVFDEVHYVPAARTLIALAAPVNAEHPLVAKELIAAGMMLFGDNSFGWRFMSSIAGAATVMGVFAIVWLLYRRTRPALMASIFVLLNFTVFIEARIAMIDPFLAAFTVSGIAATFWAMRAPTASTTWPRWIVASILLGLAVATKWAAAPYLVYVAIGFVIVRVRDAVLTGRPIRSALSGKDQPHWPGLPLIPAIAAMAVVSILAYFATFAPAFFYRTDPMTLAGLIPFQRDMYALQTQILPPHNYQSSWWTWPFLVRPIWYLYEVADGTQRGILMLGNPAIMWGGLLAIIGCAWGWVRARDPKLLFAACLWAGSYFIWAIIPKSLGFYYYYYLPSIFICIALAAALDHICRGRFQHWDEGFAIMAFGLAVYFFPIISAAPLANDQAFLHWMWLKSWP